MVHHVVGLVDDCLSLVCGDAGDLKARNIVRVNGMWILIDLDASKTIGVAPESTELTGQSGDLLALINT